MLIFKEGDNLIFVSYKTKIATWDGQKNKLYLSKKNWDYSQTTLKQLKYFINSYIEENYYKTKKDFIKKIAVNDNIVLNDTF